VCCSARADTDAAADAPARLTVRVTTNTKPLSIVEEGPIPAIHGVVRWRACDLIMRLHEQFGLSVSDDTIYRALKKLGFSHMSARPKAYKQNGEAMEAFKKTSPSVWRKSARHSQLAHR
jgi:transposase